MINIGKKLIGEDAAKYLPFALTKARQFAATFANAYISRTFVVDTATVMVEVFNKDQAQVTIWGGGGGYEFFCTGGKLTKSTAYGGIPVYLGSAVRVTLKEENGVQTLKATPIGSTLLESPEKKWDYSIDPTAMPDTYLAKGGWQVQGISEFVTFPKLKAKVALTSAWCAASDIANCNVRGASYELLNDVNAFDVFYDSAPLKLNSGASSGTEVVPDADWYRRATMATIEDPKFGVRIFFLMTTISGDLVVYTETERDSAEANGSPYAAQQIKTSIPSKYAKTINIPMSGNARKPDGKARDTASIASWPAGQTEHEKKFPQYVWKFNSTGTRMACIAYYMAAEVKLGGSPIMQPWDGESETPLREELPGIVEFAININLTGPNREDFTASLENLRDMDPFITGRVFLSCEYTWKISAIAKPSDPAEPFDLEAINPYEQKKDNLMVAEVEVFREKGYVYNKRGDYYPYGWDGALLHHMQSDLLIKNLTLGTELHRFPLSRPACKRNQRAKTFWHDSAVVIAIDLRIMAWVIQRDLIQINSASPDLYGKVKVREDYDDAGDYSDNWWKNNINGYHYDEITRATKLETWVYNKIEGEQYLSPNSPLNDLIDSRAKGEGLQPSQDRKRFEKVVPSDTLQLDVAFPFNKDGYTVPSPDPNFRGPGIPDDTIVPEEDEREARNNWLRTDIFAQPIVCLLFGRTNARGFLNWIENSAAVAYEYDGVLAKEYQGFSFQPAEWGVNINGNRYMVKNGSFSVGPGLSPLPMGAYVYNLVGVPAISVLTNNGFAIHPDGHWAAFTTPSISYEGPSTTKLKVYSPYNDGKYVIESVAEAGFGSAMFDTDASKFVQGYVDIISIKSKTGRLRTSHLAQYNKAFGKEETKQDYFYKLTEENDTAFFSRTGEYLNNASKYVPYTIEFTTKIKAIKVHTGGKDIFAMVSPLLAEGGSMPTLMEWKGEVLPQPTAAVRPTRSPFLGTEERYYCGAFIDTHPSYLMRFLGPDYSYQIPTGRLTHTRNAYNPSATWISLLTSTAQSPSLIDYNYARQVLAGSRIFYGELKGTSRVDHEDDK